MAPRKPHFSLADVKTTSQQRDGLFLTRTKAEASFATPTVALAAARTMIAGLEEKNFVETKNQNPDICDVYAVGFDGHGWYVKLTLRPDHVVLISFHILAFSIRTARGHEVKP